MRIATVLAVVSAYGAFVDALNQDSADHAMLRDLSATNNENLSEVTPLSFLSAYAYNPDPYATCSWGPNVCELNAPTNSLKLGSTCAVDVPVPSDNYVGDKRVNKYDNALESTDYPYIEITSAGPKSGLAQSIDASTGHLAWAGYMKDPTKSQNNIKFTGVGLYDMVISAYDYDRFATCEGCIAVRDTYRPRFKDGTCPPPVTGSLKLTSASIVEVSKYESDYESFIASGNQLNNPESDASCNDQSSTLQNFFDAEPAPFAGTCFSSDEVKYNLDKLKNNPFSTVHNIKRPVQELEKDLNDQCSWCCSKSIALKEKYTEYTCPSSGTQPTTACVGLTTSTCGMDACVKATGSDIAQATIKLTDDVQEGSRKVVNELGKDPNTDVANAIHHSLPCTSYDQTGNTPECHYNIKLSDVLDIGPQSGGGPGFVTDLPLNSEKPSDYVFWRAKSGSKDWATWDPKNDAELTFKASSTTVNVEAWTACGQIASIEIVIKLYLHRTLTCDKFAEMWTPLVSKVYGEDTYCNVPGSDFSLFNLDYDYGVIIPPGVGEEYERLKGTYKNVKCEIRVRKSTATEGSVNAATLVGETNEEEIDKNFAVELVHDPYTAPKTTFQVQCTFTREAFSSNDNGNFYGNGNDNTNDGNQNTNGNGNGNGNAGNDNTNAGNVNGNGNGNTNTGIDNTNGGNGNGNDNDNTNAGEEDVSWTDNGGDKDDTIENTHAGNDNTNAGNGNGNGNANTNAGNDNTNADNGNGTGNDNTNTGKDNVNAANGNVISNTTPTSNGNDVNANSNTSNGNGANVNTDTVTTGNGNGNSNTATTSSTAVPSNGNGNANSNTATTGTSNTATNSNTATTGNDNGTSNTATNSNTATTGNGNGNGNGNSNTATTSTASTNSNGNGKKMALLSFYASVAGPSQQHSITCFHSFTITDCDKPKLEPGVDEEEVCAYDCADNEKPGVNEACGGTVVSSNGAKTFVKTTPKETCCDACDPDLDCVAFGSTDVKRCQTSSVYQEILFAEEQMMFTTETTTTMMLLGASAMVAVVALVVVKRRSSHAHETEDAYYPLLD
ncbi:hypothetical protein PC111_g17689 [Phytophthora cactorum]|uniref:Uncharacterized protein n=2 Tax=Phytophthora cactorum TaxID=29920 RepID=A0A8T1C4J8_9STRA|nr:hypothetical protein PC111_g17689 [Phytophthora cactorum]KAG2914895.1 hypothetical protein PC117_g18196 [Phytophthora cactorum]